MEILLFLNFHFGDEYRVTGPPSDWFKVLIPVLIAIGTILYQRSNEKKKERKKQSLKLFNFNEHIKHIIKTSKELTTRFQEHSEKLINRPLSDFEVTGKILIPQLERILNIDKDDIFSGFINEYGYNTDSASKYRKMYDLVEHYNQLYKTLNEGFEKGAQEIYEEKKKFRDDYFIVDTSLMRLILNLKLSNNNPSELPIFNELNKFHSQYKKKEQETKEGKLTVEFYADELLVPLRDLLKNYNEFPDVFDFYVFVCKTLHNKDYIKQSSIQLGNFIKNNIEKFPDKMSEIKNLSSELSEKLQSKSP